MSLYVLAHQFIVYVSLLTLLISISTTVMFIQSITKLEDNMYTSCVILHKPGHSSISHRININVQQYLAKKNINILVTVISFNIVYSCLAMVIRNIILVSVNSRFYTRNNATSFKDSFSHYQTWQSFSLPQNPH